MEKQNIFCLVDCNNFFVSCERVFNPKLLNKPVVVLSSNDGCVVSRSKEAKALGIPMGAPAFQYRDVFKAHDVHVCSSNFFLYGDFSDRVMETLAQFSADIEIYSVDEAFLMLPLSISEKSIQDIIKTVFKWTGIPISVGLGPTKTLAKVANYLAKKSPDKNVIFLTDPLEREKRLDRLPVEEVWGIGRRISQFLKKWGIHTAKEFKDQEDGWIKKHLSVVGLRTAWELRGVCCFEMYEEVEAKKSIMTSRSFGQPVTAEDSLAEAVSTFTARGAEKLRAQNSLANYLEIFVMTNRHSATEPYYANQARIVMPEPTSYTPQLITYAKQALKSIYKQGLCYKKAGVILSGLISNSSYQQDLFCPAVSPKKQALMALIDQMNEHVSIQFAAEGLKKGWKTKKNLSSPAYTTDWKELLKIRI